MKPDDKLEYLLTEIDRLVKRYRYESAKFKKVAFRLKIISVLLAAIITILLGMKIGNNDDVQNTFSNIALILGAAITVLSAYEAFFDPRALWLRETVTFARLKDLQRDILFWRSGKDPEDIDVEILDTFKLKLDYILEDTLKYWMKVRGAPDIEKNLRARADLQSKETE